MKSLAELAAIREKMKDKVAIREGNNGIRIVVGMATCGIAAGARPVLNTFVEEIAKEDLTDKATVSQTGCIGICQYEPVVEVYERARKRSPTSRSRRIKPSASLPNTSKAVTS